MDYTKKAEKKRIDHFEIMCSLTVDNQERFVLIMLVLFVFSTKKPVDLQTAYFLVYNKKFQNENCSLSKKLSTDFFFDREQLFLKFSTFHIYLMGE